MSDRPESLSSDAALAEISSAIASLQNGAGDTAPLASAIVTQTTAAVDEPLKSIQLAHTLLALVKSPLSAETVLAALKDAFKSIDGDEERTGVLATGVLEMFDALKLVAEDVEDLTKNDVAAIDVDSATKASVVVDGLIQSGALPKHLANLILTPVHLLPLRLHPTPRQPDALRRGLGRLNTSVHFKQRTTNLLRESSEGFSRLIILLTGPVSLYKSPETDDERAIRAKRVWDGVRDLIGYFNLAPIRVYDLILEVASCHIEKHWRFFLELLRQAGLGPKAEPKSTPADGDASAEADRIAHVLDVSETDDTMISRALAFRFRWYKNTDNGKMPIPLVFLTALLVKYGFVKPGHLLPALSPDEDGMSDIQKRFQGAMSSRSGANNALMNTVLVDDEALGEGGASAAAEVVEPPKPEAEQKVLLLQALLAIGESDFALYLLAQNPWVVSAYPHIADLIIRNLNRSISHIYDTCVSRSGTDDNVPRLAWNPEIVLTTLYPPPPSTMSTEWQFFYNTWADDVEVWTELEDVHRKGERWFAILKSLGGRDAKLMARVCRIMVEHFRQLRKAKIEAKGFDPAHLTYDQRSELLLTAQELAPWRSIIRHTILPALNISQAVSAPFANEVGDIFASFDWPTVASLIGEWRESTTNLKARTAILPAAHAAGQSTREVKQALQRVTAATQNSSNSMTTDSQTADRGPARALAKHGQGNPLALWTTGNGQVMSYGSVGNIGEFFMDVARYSGTLSKEVAVFTWVDTLASSKNARGIENLATFVGIINRQFTFNLEPLLHLVATGIKKHEPFALPLVEKLLTGMTGEDIVENHAISVAQLHSYASGPEMTREAFYASENTCNEDRKAVRSRELIAAARRSVVRLVTALSDTRLAVPILVGLARLATEVLLYEPGVPIKAMSDQKDRTRDIFSLWCGFVTDKLTELGCADQIPSLTELQGDSNIDEQLCWAILRPKLRAALATAHKENGDANGDANGMDVDASNAEWWPAPLNETVQQAAAFLEPAVKAVLGPGFFVRFNSLRISDIALNEPAYKTARENLAKIIRQLQLSLKTTKLSPKVVNGEIVRLKERDAELKAEEAKQKVHVERVRAELQNESQHWFAKCVELGRDGALANQLHDHCFYLRATQTPADAIFTARFIRLLHDLNTPGFSTIHAYMFFLQDKLASKLFESTESEARNLGRALMLMMGDLDAWHGSETKYYEEALGGPAPDKDNMPDYPKQGMFVRTKPGEPKRPILHGIFKDMLGKMHNGLTNALLTCWKDGMFYSPKNAVVIALQLLPYFPVIEANARSIENAVKALLAKTDGSITPDMKPAFNSYLSQLKTRRLQRPCVPASQFYPAAAKAAKAAAEKAKKEAAAKAQAEAEAKAKAEAEARAKAEAEAPAGDDAAKMDVDAPAAATEAKADESAGSSATPPPAGASTADAKALRAKLEQSRMAREAKKAVAAAESPSQPRGAASPHPDRAAGLAMAPPPEPSIEDSRAAARARRFGALGGGSAPTTPRDESRSSTPRHTPPRETRARAGTDDSRVSERSRRHDERERREGDKKEGRGSRDGGSRDGHERESERDRRDRARERDREGREKEPRAARDSRERRLEPRDEEPQRDPRAREDRHREERRGDERPRARSRDREDRHRDRGWGTRDDRDGRDGRDARERDRRHDRRDERPAEATGPAGPAATEGAQSDSQSRDGRSTPIQRPDSRNQDRLPPGRGDDRRPDVRPDDRGRDDRRERGRRGGGGGVDARDQRDQPAQAPNQNQLPPPITREAPPHRGDERDRGMRNGMRSPRPGPGPDRMDDRGGRDGRRLDDRRAGDRRPDDWRADDGRRRRRDEPPPRDGRDGGRTPHERGGSGRETPRGPRDEAREPRRSGEREREGDAPASAAPEAAGSGGRSPARGPAPRGDRSAPASQRGASPQRQPDSAQAAAQSQSQPQSQPPPSRRDQPPREPRREPPSGPSGLPSKPAPPSGPRDAPATTSTSLPEKPSDNAAPTGPSGGAPPAQTPARDGRSTPTPAPPLSKRAERRERDQERAKRASAGGSGTPGGQSRELFPATSAGSSLMARMGLAPSASASPAGSPPVPGASNRERERERDRERERERNDKDRDSRKRPLDSEGAPSSREGSPGTKRHRAGRGRREERGTGLSRMFQSAMRQSSEKK